MNNYLKILSLFLGVLFMVSCGKEEITPLEINDVTDIQDLLSEEDLDNSLALMLDEPEVTDATETIEFDILNEGVPEALEAIDFPEIEGFVQDSLGKRDSLKLRCKRLWDSIPLTDTQKVQLKAVRSQYLKCKKSSIIALRTIHRSYILKANQAKKKLIQAYKNGDITQAELKQKLVQLNKRTKLAIRNDQQRQAIVIRLRNCHKNYLKAVKSILSPAQWQAFLKCRKILYRGV